MYSFDEPNIGGVNGHGLNPIDTESGDFQALRDAITTHASVRSRDDRQKDQILSVKLRMRAYLSQTDESLETDAGALLSDLIAGVGITKKHFARYVGIDYSNLIAVLKGRRRISAELAIKLEKIFGINATYWLQIETRNELLRFKNKHKASYDYSLLELTQ